MYGKEVLPLSLINGSLTNITVFRHSFLCANWRNLRFYPPTCLPASVGAARDRKSTRLNSSHSQISYAVFCLKKKKKTARRPQYGLPPLSPTGPTPRGD